MKEIAEHYGVGETVVFKRLKEHGIALDGIGPGGHRKVKGKPKSPEHIAAMRRGRLGKYVGEANPNWRGGASECTCAACGRTFTVPHARSDSAVYCSVECRAKAQEVQFRGDGNPRWIRGDRATTRSCGTCGRPFTRRPTEAVSTFSRRKFCSAKCGSAGQVRHRGEAHPRYRADSRKKVRTGAHSSWANAVIARDHGTCSSCGASEVEMHAHHIKPYRDFPELRFAVENGVTLCHRCHRALHRKHSADSAIEQVVEERVDGHMVRRIHGRCEYCGKAISRSVAAWNLAKHHHCSRSCAGKARQARATKAA